MISKNFENFFSNKNLIFLLFYLSILIGFYFDENSLGGAQQDFIHHYKFSQEFNNNFFEVLIILEPKIMAQEIHQYFG